MNKLGGKTICIACAVLFLPVIFLSCSNNVERKSFNSQLDQIDTLINQNLYKDAEKELNKLEKNFYGSWAEIGIFKRYKRIELNQKAESVLIKAIKKNPENQELRAVYTNFLSEQNKLQEALIVGKKLQGTKYGSIYSELVLKDTLAKSQSQNLRQIFKEEEYIPIYYDAYEGTKDNAWLRNCALINLSNGFYEKAASVHPLEVFGSDDAYFWAMVMYDANLYADCINYALTSESLINKSSGTARKRVSNIKLSSLMADSYISLSDAESSEGIRKNVLSSITNYNDSWILPTDKDSLNLLPYVFVNSAKWANDNFEDHKAEKLLTFCVDNWPDFVPALTSYADFALKSNQQRKEDTVQLQLRDQGLLTLEMEKYDSRAIIPVSDAVYRIEKCIERTNSPLLSVVRLDIKYKTELNLNEKEKISNMWRTLEKSALAPSIYPEILLCYADNFFLNNGETEGAWSLFYKYISNKYSIALDEDFWENLVRSLDKLTYRESELASYFACLSLRADDAIRISEYSVFESSALSDERYISSVVSDKTCVNLAMIYNSLGFTDKAIDLYGKINGRSSDSKLKSIVMYRMALIYYKNNDISNARRCAEYSITLDKKNADSKLLLAKIKA